MGRELSNHESLLTGKRGEQGNASQPIFEVIKAIHETPPLFASTLDPIGPGDHIPDANGAGGTVSESEA